MDIDDGDRAGSDAWADSDDLDSEEEALAFAQIHHGGLHVSDVFKQSMSQTHNSFRMLCFKNMYITSNLLLGESEWVHARPFHIHTTTDPFQPSPNPYVGHMSVLILLLCTAFVSERAQLSHHLQKARHARIFHSIDFVLITSREYSACLPLRLDRSPRKS